MTTPQPRRVLFLCSGNYYRSRYAEMIFNALAQQANLHWQADSCGLVVDRLNSNIGAISSYTVQALQRRQIALPATHRAPVQVCTADFERADLVVAVKEAEHRPMLRARFPNWEDQVEYWHIHDLDYASADQALAEIEEKVQALVERLAQEQDREEKSEERASHE